MSSPDPGDDTWLRHALLELRPGLHTELAERLAQVVLQLGGPNALSAFPSMASELKGSETELPGPLKDRSAVFGALAQIEALGLELLALQRIRPRSKSPGSDDGRSPRGV